MGNPILYTNKQQCLIEIFGQEVIKRFKNPELEIRDEIDREICRELIIMYKSRSRYSVETKHGIKLYLLYLKTRYPKFKEIEKWTCDAYVDIHTDILTGYVKYPKLLWNEYKEWENLHTDESKEIRDKLNEIKDSVRSRRQSTE